MEWPKKLKIGYRDYTLRFSKAKKQAALGQTWVDDAKIVIDGRQEPKALANTVLHEALHGIYYESGLYRLIDNDEKEEHIVTFMTDGLTRFIQDNPDAFRKILRDIFGEPHV